MLLTSSALADCFRTMPRAPGLAFVLAVKRYPFDLTLIELELREKFFTGVKYRLN